VKYSNTHSLEMRGHINLVLHVYCLHDSPPSNLGSGVVL